jgi:hypothetical protein
MTIDNINKITEKYFNKNYVFSTCNNDWLIIFYINNIDSNIIHPCAFNRGTQLYVVDMINKNNIHDVVNSLSTSFIDINNNCRHMTITKNEYVDDYFYFISASAAFFYELPHNYSGKCIKWGIFGNKICEGMYVNELKHSTWTYYSNDDIVKCKIIYVYGVKHSLHKYRSNGTKTSEQNYDKNNKCVQWFVWDEHERISVEGKLKNNIKHHVLSEYYESGKLKSLRKYVDNEIFKIMTFSEHNKKMTLYKCSGNENYTDDNFITYFQMD